MRRNRGIIASKNQRPSVLNVANPFSDHFTVQRRSRIAIGDEQLLPLSGMNRVVSAVEGFRFPSHGLHGESGQNRQSQNRIFHNNSLNEVIY